MSISDERVWVQIEAAVATVAKSLGLSETWLNQDCKIYAHQLPVGWRTRCEDVGKFGPLKVVRISRSDLIASKAVSCLGRPQDLEDLMDMKPTNAELDFAEKNLDRLTMEGLGDDTYDKQRVILTGLREGAQ